MPRKKSKANYFTKETEDYIVKYNTSTDIEYRQQIFTDHIYLPFYKLAENIIHTFKFYYTDVNKIEDLKHEIVSILLEQKISKFDPTNGAKAYSYFGTIVKRWLISYNNTNYKKLKQVGSWDTFEDSYIPNTVESADSSSQITLALFIDRWVEETYDKLEILFDKDEDMNIADAILTIFKTRNDLELFKKKALYIYIREMTNCKTPNLTKVIQVLKSDFYEKYLDLYDRGLISTLKV
jgi:hypothetical protein